LALLDASIERSERSIKAFYLSLGN